MADQNVYDQIWARPPILTLTWPWNGQISIFLDENFFIRLVDISYTTELNESSKYTKITILEQKTLKNFTKSRLSQNQVFTKRAVRKIYLLLGFLRFLHAVFLHRVQNRLGLICKSHFFEKKFRAAQCAKMSSPLSGDDIFAHCAARKNIFKKMAPTYEPQMVLNPMQKTACKNLKKPRRI